MANSVMPTDHSAREQEALDLYASEPLNDGDGLLLLDGSVILELATMADEWDPVGRDGLVGMLMPYRRVVLAIARRGARLRAGDQDLWRELQRELVGTGVDLLPLRALPAE